MGFTGSGVAMSLVGRCHRLAISQMGSAPHARSMVRSVILIRSKAHVTRVGGFQISRRNHVTECISKCCPTTETRLRILMIVALTARRGPVHFGHPALHKSSSERQLRRRS